MSTYINEQATLPVIRGFNIAANATKLSMGYEGKYAFIESQAGIFSPTKDGVTIAKSVFSNNPHEESRKAENIGCQLAKQICAKQVIEAGDSTTAALVFAQSVVNEGYRYLNPKQGLFTRQPLVSEFRRGMEIAIGDFERLLSDLSQPVTDAQIEAIATISANNDEQIGEMLTKVYKELGKEGIVEIELGQGESTTYKMIKGMRVDRGMKSPFFANTQKGTAELEEPYVFLFDGYVGDLRILTEVFNKAVTDNKPLLLVADDFSEEVVLLLQNNFERGMIQVCPVRSPDLGTRKRHLMEDIAAFTGTEVFTQGFSSEMKLGTARKITVGKETTEISQDTYFEGVGPRVEMLKVQLEDNPEDPESLLQRIASLSAGVAVISVGEKSDAARREKKDRFDDAKHAIQSSVAEGSIAGGGAGLAYIASEMYMEFDRKEKDCKAGYEAIRNCLYAPFNTIMENAGLNPDQYIGHIESEYGVGFNLKTKKVEYLIDSNIIDSAKSLRLALKNAESIASLMLNTQVISTL